MKRTAIILLLCGVLLLSACSRSGEEVRPVPTLLDPVGVTTDSAVCKYGEIYNVNQFAASVVPYVEELSLSIDGVVEEMLVYPGQSVKAGDALLTLNLESIEDQADALQKQIDYTKTIYRYENEQTQLSIRMQELTLNRMKSDPEADTSAVAAQEAAVADAKLTFTQRQQSQQLELEIMERSLAKLRTKLGQNTIYAPFDGVVAYCMDLKEGSYLPAYTVAIYLADESRLFLQSEYVTSNQAAFADRILARIGGEDYSVTIMEEDYSRTLSDVWAGFIPTSSFTVDDENAPLKVGEYVSITMLTHYREHVLTVPTNAILKDMAGNYVYVISEDGTRTRTSVTVGVHNDSISEITEGLKEGDVVYVKE